MILSKVTNTLYICHLSPLWLTSIANARLLYGRDSTYEVVTYQAADYHKDPKDKSGEADQVGATTALLVAYDLPAERDGFVLMTHTVGQKDTPITVPKAVNALAKELRHEVARYDQRLKKGVTFTGMMIKPPS